ncbi:5424_t:CDS:2 [Funneliformis mosseae]|uniref:5424_t:CDS:1 n=1 Tax=Funneliformis mosseae TaxID=27381 RepID=A0A9N9H344_FUNMO|nr:5424_t:CDS:2 [Funneliformis mosseae]
MISTILFDIPSILISVGVGIVTYLAYFYFKFFTRPNPIPGPIPLPFIGNLHQYPGDMSEFSETCQKKYGDIWEFYIGHPSDKTRGIGLGRAELLEKEKINVDSTVLKESEEFIKRINDFITSLQYFLLTPKWLRHFPGGFKKKTMRLLKERDNMRKDLLKLVTQRREEINNTPLDEPITPDMLSMFLTVNTERDITEQIANETNTEPMTDEAIVGNFMEAVSGEETLDKYIIPAETQFFINQRGINKHKSNWTNPEKFDPDRFINGQDKNLAFQFGGGARMCPATSRFSTFSGE